MGLCNELHTGVTLVCCIFAGVTLLISSAYSVRGQINIFFSCEAGSCRP